MGEYFERDVINYYLNEVEQNNYIGIVSPRNTGKTMLGVILLIETVINRKLDGVVFIIKFSMGVHIMDKVIYVLTQYGIPYEISNKTKTSIEFMGLSIQFKRYTDIQSFGGYDKKVTFVDDISIVYRDVDGFVSRIPYFSEYLIFSDLSVIPQFQNIKTFNTNVSRNDIRKLKLKRLLNNE